MSINIGIGEKIKNFRQKRGITQEQLAEYLNISFQSVSKWERGEAYPDITMLPKIAIFFNTTTDELLCIDKAKADEEVESYFQRKFEADGIGETAKSIEIMREANAKYPGNFKLMKGLMSAIHFHDCHHNPGEESAKREIIEIGEKIRAECTDDNIRRDVLQVLCFTYSYIGEKEKAEKLARDNLPSVYLTADCILKNILEGEKLIEHTQDTISTSLEFFTGDMEIISKNYDPAEKISVYETIMKIYSMIYVDGDYGYRHCGLSDYCIRTAKLYLKLDNKEKAVEYLLKSADHRISFDTLKLPMQHTSPLVNKCKFKGITKNYKGNATFIMLEELKDEIFNPLREAEQFKNIEENLKKYARDDI